METELTAEQRSYLEIIRSSGDSLLRIISDVLDLSKIESSNLQLECVSFDVRAHAHEAVALLAVVAKEKGLALRCHVAPSVPQFVAGDPVRLRQVLLNLVSNAIKFTSEGQVDVTISQVELRDAPATSKGTPARSKQETVLCFEVRDTGLGMDDSVKAHLFQPFTQADSSIGRRFGGTGLGLAISKSLVELMGGSIGVSSQPGQGSTFHFTACLGVGERHDSVPPPALCGGLHALGAGAGEGTAGGGPAGHAALQERVKELKVLVVEDNQVNQVVVTRMLSFLGAKYDLVVNGVQAVRACSERQYDLVLMDCHMPEMDGLEATRRIRAHERRFPDRPQALIVALTASALSHEQDSCIQAGMDLFLMKPVKPKDLEAVLLSKVQRAVPAM
eukprot:jgi/Mesen1/10947/ME000096S10525